MKLLTVLTSILMCGAALAQVPSSGHSYRAVEVLHNPNRDLGKMIALDAWGCPLIGGDGNLQGPYDRAAGVVVPHYEYLPPYMVQSGYVGMRFNRRLKDNLLLFDVMASGTSDSAESLVQLGQIAVQVSGPGVSLDQTQIWDVEPKGTLEGTTQAGLVIRIPLVHFWKYQGRLAIPQQQPAPAVEVEPVVDSIRGVKIAERLYVLRDQLKSDVELTSLATCGVHCDMAKINKTQASLGEFNSEVSEFKQFLHWELNLLAAKKDYRLRHGEETESVIKDENIETSLLAEVENKDERYAAWVGNQIVRRLGEYPQPGDFHPERNR